MPMTLEEFLRRLCLEGGERILLIDEQRALYAGDEKTAAEAVQSAPTSVGVVPLIGSVYPDKLSAFSRNIGAAAANPDVGHIVIPVDSPGGTYSGTPEAAAAVAAAAAQKPVTAHIMGLGASASYWIPSQASHVVMNPSSDAGSIGVLSMHMELSQALEAMGYKATIIRSVPHKAEANSLEPLTEDAKAHIQADVDRAHGEFVRAVASGRRVSQAKVESDFGRGRLMHAKAAVDAGMADRIGTLSDTLARARTRMASARRRSAAFL